MGIVRGINDKVFYVLIKNTDNTVIISWFYDNGSALDIDNRVVDVSTSGFDEVCLEFSADILAIGRSLSVGSPIFNVIKTSTVSPYNLGTEAHSFIDSSINTRTLKGL